MRIIQEPNTLELWNKLQTAPSQEYKLRSPRVQSTIPLSTRCRTISMVRSPHRVRPEYNRGSSCFETTVPLQKHCVRLMHFFPKVCRSIFRVSVAVFPPEFEPKFHTHALFFQVLHFHCLKKIASRSLHLFTAVAVPRLLAVIEWCGKKHIVNNGCRYSTPLATLRSLHWFRRCALISVFFLS